MTASTPGSYLMEQAGQGTVPPVKVATSAERRAGVVVGMNNLAARSGVSFSVLGRHSVLDTEPSLFNWIPAFAGMTAWGIMSRSIGCITLRAFTDTKHGHDHVIFK